MKVFFDTSAFVKRYMEEPGTDKVIEICRQAEELVLSIVCIPEMMSTLNRLVREERITRRDYLETRDLILQEVRDVEICCVTGEVVSQTMKCVENYPLGAMEALNLGCALVVSPDLFVSSSQRQLDAAFCEGLSTARV